MILAISNMNAQNMPEIQMHQHHAYKCKGVCLCCGIYIDKATGFVKRVCEVWTKENFTKHWLGATCGEAEGYNKNYNWKTRYLVFSMETYLVFENTR